MLSEKERKIMIIGAIIVIFLLLIYSAIFLLPKLKQKIVVKQWEKQVEKEMENLSVEKQEYEQMQIDIWNKEEAALKKYDEEQSKQFVEEPEEDTHINDMDYFNRFFLRTNLNACYGIKKNELKEECFWYRTGFTSIESSQHTDVINIFSAVENKNLNKCYSIVLESIKYECIRLVNYEIYKDIQSTEMDYIEIHGTSNLSEWELNDIGALVLALRYIDTELCEDMNLAVYKNLCYEVLS